jgi:hypothetical protein
VYAYVKCKPKRRISMAKFNLFSLFKKKTDSPADVPVVGNPVIPDLNQTQTTNPVPAPDSSFGTMTPEVTPRPVAAPENVANIPVEPSATPYQPANPYQPTPPTGGIADVFPQPTTPPENNSPSSPTPMS